MRSLALLLLLLAFSPVLGAQASPVAINRGITDLLAAVPPSVGYALDGQPTVTLGTGWSGYDANSGVYYVPGPSGDGGTEVFMHCAWAKGPGVTYADYSLHLPRAPQVKLTFEMGLRPGAVGSDGVTYRVQASGETVFEEHCTARGFLRRAADLSAYAGRDVVLRLSVDPGPARKTTDDWSLWRDLQLLAGSDAQLAEARRQAEAAAARRKAQMLAHARVLADLPLTGLTSHYSNSVCPSVAGPTRVSARAAAGGVYVFTCEGDGDSIEYRLDAHKGLWAGLTVTANGKLLDPPPFTGGVTAHLDGEDLSVQAGQLETELLGALLGGLHLRCQYRFTNPATGSTADLTVVLWPEGKSLGLDVTGEPGRFSGFAACTNAGMPVQTAFAYGGQLLWRNEGVYLRTVTDLMRSDASGFGAGDRTVYVPLTNGVRNAMRDRLYLTVTSRYEEALPNHTSPPSPFLADLARRNVLDAWNGGFAGDEQWLREMDRYGVNRLLFIKHVWQRDGYDQTYPDTMPANAGQGGDEALRSLSLTAQALGNEFNVHENYYDYYPNAESFRAADRCLTSAGQEILGWDNGLYHAVILKPSKLMDYVDRFTTEIKRRYDCDSAYHDIMPTWHVDYDATAPGAGKVRFTHGQTRALCNFDRAILGGPVVFEAADPIMAGVYDGGCNYGVDTYKTPVAVADELLKVHPLMSNHGFGYYERWLPWGYAPGWYDYVMTDRELDKYRAYQTAFGRTSFIGHQLMPHPHAVVREFYLGQAFGRAYTGKLVQRLRYEVDGQWVDAGTAARLGVLKRINAEYEDGQQVYVNLADSPWHVQGRELPQFGTLTLGPRAEAWTAVRDGQIADYGRYGNVTYADARSHIWRAPEPPAPIKPTAEFKALGGGQFELTMSWQVGRQLDRDYTSFWHFVAGGIRFQYDHQPTTPTSQWQVGGTATDGSARFTVPDDATVMEYQVNVGLYTSQGRATLVNGGDQVHVGTLKVTRDGAVATRLEFVPPDGKPLPGSDASAYREGANLDKKVLDFGEVATNGAVVLRATAAGREIIPVPLGEVFEVGLSGAVQAVEAADAAGQTLPAPALKRHDGKTWFETAPEAVLYRVRS